jgi:O-antigen ligase
VTAFFSSPNAVGLYLESLIVLTVGYYLSFRSSVPDPRQALLPAIDRRRRILLVALPALIGLQLLAVVFTKSDGTVLALGAALVVSLFLAGYKKIVAALVVLAIVTTVLVPKIHSVVLFRDQSGQNRLTLWSYSLEFLTASPKNFVAGAGVRQFFRKIQKPHYDVKKMERLIYPHNIVFNFWTETGLLGLLGFMGMIGYLGICAHRLLRSNRSSGILVTALLTVTLVHGMVDVPYFKNDLAMLWWLASALLLQINIFFHQKNNS